MPASLCINVHYFLMSFICCDLLKGWVTLTKGQLRYFVLSFFRCSVAMLYQTNCCSYMIDDVSCLILRYCNSKHLQTTYQQQRTKKSNKRTFSFLTDSYCYWHFVSFKRGIHDIHFNIPFSIKGNALFAIANTTNINMMNKIYQ